MEKKEKNWRNLSQPNPQIPPTTLSGTPSGGQTPSGEQTNKTTVSGSLKTPNDGQKTGLKHWLGGLVNNPNTGALSHDKVWAHICAAAMTWKFCQSDPTEWQWWAYGGMVGGYGLARRAIAAMQQVAEKQKEKD